MATNWTCVECRMEVLFTAHGARVAKIRIKDLKPAGFFGGNGCDVLYVSRIRP